MSEMKSNHRPALRMESYAAIPDVMYQWGHSISGASRVEADSALSMLDRTSIAEDARVNHRKTFF